MIITGNDNEEIKLLRKYCSKTWYLYISKKYIIDLLIENELLKCKPAEILIVADHGLQIIWRGTSRFRPISKVGREIDIHLPRPDIAYAVRV